MENGTNKIIEKTKPRRQETLEFKLNDSNDTFSFIFDLNIEGISLVGVTRLGVCDSILKVRGKPTDFQYTPQVKTIKLKLFGKK